MTYNGAGLGFEGAANGPAYYVGANNGFRLWELVNVADRSPTYHLPNFDPDSPIRWALKSLVMSYAWRPGINRSECLKTWGPSGSSSIRDEKGQHYPSTGCACGFYAYYERDRFWSEHSRHATTPRVWGLMEGWGRCVVGDLGFRSEYASVSAFVVDPSGDGIPLPWLRGNNLTPESGLQVVRSVLESLFPTVPVFDTTDDMLKVVPLHGRPR